MRRSEIKPNARWVVGSYRTKDSIARCQQFDEIAKMQAPNLSCRKVNAEFVDSIICDDAASGLSRLPMGIADVIVTSPPYYHQKDYSHTGQIGNEFNPETYIGRLVQVFRECLRVVSDQGTPG